MKKTRYSDEQIVRILRETDKDTVAEVAKRHAPAVRIVGTSTDVRV